MIKSSKSCDIFVFASQKHTGAAVHNSVPIIKFSKDENLGGNYSPAANDCQLVNIVYKIHRHDTQSDLSETKTHEAGSI